MKRNLQESPTFLSLFRFVLFCFVSNQHWPRNEMGSNLIPSANPQGVWIGT